jgi:hypothetical protein
MTREKMIEKMVKAANKLRKEYSWEAQKEIWEMCLDWNSEHEDEEIFMCEHENEETGLVDGFYIEDDFWTFE